MSDGSITLLIVVVIVVATIVFLKVGNARRLARMTPEEREKAIARDEAARKELSVAYKYGDRNPALVCPHCQTAGLVRAKGVSQKKGVSGGKATAAVLTGGLSVVATGLSRKEHNTQAHCDNCNSTWTF